MGPGDLVRLTRSIKTGTWGTTQEHPVGTPCVVIGSVAHKRLNLVDVLLGGEVWAITLDTLEHIDETR